MPRARIVVVGAGVFGGFTALNLQQQGVEVTLVEAWGPGHARASSGGESRILRATYGDEGIYVAWVLRSLELWRGFEQAWDVQLFHRTGSLWLAGEDDTAEKAALHHLRTYGVDFEELTPEEAFRRFPQFNLEDVSWCLYEPEAGYLLARQACQRLHRAFVGSGGRYIQATARPTSDGTELSLSNGERLPADAFVFACGPWLGPLFPELGADLVQASRQEVFFFGPPDESSEYENDRCPVWIDNGTRRFYGIPGTEWRGLKLADDSRGDPADPTTMDRLPSPGAAEAARDYLTFRFPGMRGAPLVESRVCQYEHSIDSRFIIDRHPDKEKIWIVGGGSGHGFKHGPVVGEQVAGNVLGEKAIEPYFALSRFG